jgi:exodeoxyribonuclease VII large subunit
MVSKSAKIYTVSEINSLIKEALEDFLPGRLTIVGEITDWKVHQSGHCYFTLKDEDSKLPCVMWKSKFGRVKFEPENGLAVVAKGYVDVYPPQGKYQFYVESMLPEGVGALQLKFEQILRRLKEEGLFDDAHKKALPVYPERIGIVTSESGAAVHDIADSIYNRWPCAKLFLYPVPVQGEGAAEEIAAAIREVNGRNREYGLELLIVGRGGGSLEDLWAFNEEVVAMAIYESKIPVISAVGHEIDTTIADLVADARASTPTKAGIIAVPDKEEVLEQLEGMGSRLGGEIRGRLRLAGQHLETVLASSVFRNPLLAVRNREQRLDEFAGELGERIRQLLAAARQRVAGSYEKVSRIEPHRLLGRWKVELNNLAGRTDSGVRAGINKCRMGLTAQMNRLGALNPRSVLGRGYSITKIKKTGQLVKRLEDVRIGDLLITELVEENLIESEVKKKQNRDK